MAIAPGHFSEGSRFTVGKQWIWKPTRWTYSCTIWWIQILTFVQKSKVFFSILENPQQVVPLTVFPWTVPFQRKILQGYKLRLAEQWDFKLKFPDPRPFIQKHGLAPTPFPVPLMGKDGSVWKDPIFRGKQSHALNCKGNIHKHIRLLYSTVCCMSYSAVIWLLGPNFCSLASDRKVLCTSCDVIVTSLWKPLWFMGFCSSIVSDWFGWRRGTVWTCTAKKFSLGGPRARKFSWSRWWMWRWTRMFEVPLDQGMVWYLWGIWINKNLGNGFAKAKSIWMNHISGILYLL